jgi:lipoyl(octanoyl) transferase
LYPLKQSPFNSLYSPSHYFTLLKKYPESNKPEANLEDTEDKKRRCFLVDLGLISYSSAWEYQRSLLKERINNNSLPDVLLLLEHPPVYTLGTGANSDFLKFDPAETGWEVHRVERGGEVTYHCQGQLIGYPILNLRYYQQDLYWYLRQLEEVIIRVLQQYGLAGYRLKNYTGVWLEGCKVAAIGVKVSRWITMHGFSLNVCPDLTGFEHIVPCGIEDKPVGSLAQFIPDIGVDRVKQDVKKAFAEVFQIDLYS